MHKQVTEEFKVAPKDQQTNTDWAFNKMMAYFIRDGLEKGFRPAKLSAQSDMNKVAGDDTETAFLNYMIINEANDAKSLISMVAGFSSMSKEVKKYYNNPEKAMHDYAK